MNEASAETTPQKTMTTNPQWVDNGLLLDIFLIIIGFVFGAYQDSLNMTDPTVSKLYTWTKK